MRTPCLNAGRTTVTLFITGAIGLGGVLAASYDCGGKTCSPAPCPAPGWDPDTCRCRLPELVDASNDAAPPDEGLCPGDGPPPIVWDGGVVLGNFCCEQFTEARSREAPTGSCTGSKRCKTEVHQVCPGLSMAPPVGPVDLWTCDCDGQNWQCTLTSMGAGTCSAPDAGDR